MLPHLTSITLRECELPSPGNSHILRSHFNLTFLVSLDIEWNNLHYSSTLLKLFNLLTDKIQVLKLENNNFEGSIPFLLRRFTFLTIFDISRNAFSSSSLLNSLCNHSSLSTNQFEGSLPVCLGNLTYLNVLNLGYNELGGKIPSELGHLKQLIYLDLSRNSFHSSIPSSFEELTELQFLYLGGNQLYGKVPTALGQLGKLQELDISNNQLTDVISELHLMKLKSLKLLEFSDNKFLAFNMSPKWIPSFQLKVMGMDGVYIGNHFPVWLQSQKNVVELCMENVNVSADTIPEWFWTTFSGVQQLDLSMNNMYGKLPSSMKNLKSLVAINLGENKFNDTLPEWIGEMSQLKYLILQSNNFHGKLPTSLMNLKELAVLDLSENQFNGILPEWIGEELSLLEFLGFQSNNFYCVIPSSLKNLKILYYLDLAQNHFTGSLTEWIGEEFSALEILYLQSNNFYGNIPIQLCHLPKLSRLRLANNNLTGHISDCFDH